MRVQEIIEYLYGLPRITKGGHMENVKRLLAALGDPQETFAYIHVTGTNGKGSVCAYIERCLRLCQYKTGLFTSPHLVRVNERLRICGNEITDEEFVRVFCLVDETAKKEMESGAQLPTFFEYLYLMAMVWFAQQQVDYGIIEAGMGGGRDYTNAVRSPALTVITPVSLDHVPLLGSTIEEIAAEKAGILKPGVPAVSACDDERAANVIARAAKDRGVQVTFLDHDSLHVRMFTPGGNPDPHTSSHTTEEDFAKGIDFSMKCKYHGSCTFSLRTPAVYQAENAALAVLALEELQKEQKQADFLQNTARGLWLAGWPGRMEQVAKRFYVDGAHNEAGARAFAASVRAAFGGHPLILIAAVALDKDYEAMIRNLSGIPSLDTVIVTELENGRRRNAGDVARIFSEYFSGEIRIADTIREAVEMGLALRTQDGILCCAGSLYLVGSIKELIGGMKDDQL